MICIIILVIVLFVFIIDRRGTHIQKNGVFIVIDNANNVLHTGSYKDCIEQAKSMNLMFNDIAISLGYKQYCKIKRIK